MSETATATAPDTQTASLIAISGGGSAPLVLTPSTLICQPNDKICWVNNAVDTVSVTLPGCVSGNGPISLAAGYTSNSYNVNNGASGSSNYSATMGSQTASASIMVETTVTITIPASGPPATIDCAPGTKVVWTNNSGYSATLTLPSCVSPQNGPITIANGGSSSSYNTNNGNGTFNYNVTVDNGEQDTRSGTVDING